VVLRNRRIGLLSQGSVNTEYGIQAHRREHRQAAGAARGSPQLARRNEVCGGTLTMSAPRRLVLQLRRYRCNVATTASGHDQTCASQQQIVLFDHLVGACQ
jgi:hypothetical protein